MHHACNASGMRLSLSQQSKENISFDCEPTHVGRNAANAMVSRHFYLWLNR